METQTFYPHQGIATIRSTRNLMKSSAHLSSSNAKVVSNAKKRKLRRKQPRVHRVYNVSILRSGSKEGRNALLNAIFLFDKRHFLM